MEQQCGGGDRDDNNAYSTGENVQISEKEKEQNNEQQSMPILGDQREGQKEKEVEMQQGTSSFQINISSKLAALPVHSHQQIAIQSSAKPNTIPHQNVDSATGTASHYETNEAEAAPTMANFQSAASLTTISHGIASSKFKRPQPRPEFVAALGRRTLQQNRPEIGKSNEVDGGNHHSVEMRQGTPSLQINISSKLAPLPVHSHQRMAIQSTANPTTISHHEFGSINSAASLMAFSQQNYQNDRKEIRRKKNNARKNRNREKRRQKEHQQINNFRDEVLCTEFHTELKNFVLEFVENRRHKAYFKDKHAQRHFVFKIVSIVSQFEKIYGMANAAPYVSTFLKQYFGEKLDENDNERIRNCNYNRLLHFLAHSEDFPDGPNFVYEPLRPSGQSTSTAFQNFVSSPSNQNKSSETRERVLEVDLENLLDCHFGTSEMESDGCANADQQKKRRNKINGSLICGDGEIVQISENEKEQNDVQQSMPILGDQREGQKEKEMEMQQGTSSFQINISSKLTPLPVSHQQIAISSSAEPNTIPQQNVDSIDSATGTASNFETNEAEAAPTTANFQSAASLTTISHGSASSKFKRPQPRPEFVAAIGRQTLQQNRPEISKSNEADGGNHHSLIGNENPSLPANASKFVENLEQQKNRLPNNEKRWGSMAMETEKDSSEFIANEEPKQKKPRLGPIVLHGDDEFRPIQEIGDEQNVEQQLMAITMEKRRKEQKKKEAQVESTPTLPHHQKLNINIGPFPSSASLRGPSNCQK